MPGLRIERDERRLQNLLFISRGDRLLFRGRPLGGKGMPVAPSEVGKLVVFLSSDDAAYITGATHIIDGALTAIPAG